jgi:hypothetical protein
MPATNVRALPALLDTISTRAIFTEWPKIQSTAGTLKSCRTCSPGRVESDASFRLYQPRGSEAAAPGDYQVTLTFSELKPDGTQGPNRLPERYSKPGTSTLKATVQTDGRNEFVFELTN